MFLTIFENPRVVAGIQKRHQGAAVQTGVSHTPVNSDTLIILTPVSSNFFNVNMFFS